MKALGFPVKKRQVREMIKNIDKDDNAQVNFEEFVTMMDAKFSEKTPEEEIIKIFTQFDFGKKGYLDFNNAKKMAEIHNTGPRFTQNSALAIK